MIIHSPIFSGSITQAESAYANLSGSFTGSFTGVGNFTGLEADSVEFANVLNKPTLISSSVQVDANSVTNFDVNVLSYIDTLGVFSGSSQVDGTGITNNSITVAGTSVSLGGSISLGTITAGSNIVSGSDQLYADLDSRYGNELGDGLVSASNQISAFGIFAELDGDNLVSSSAQIDGTAITNNTITIAGNSTALGGSVSLSAITNGSGLVSGSSQVDVTATTNYSSIEQYSDTKVKTKLNVENVISSSAQLYADLDERYSNELGDGIISSSAQITAFGIYAELNGDNLVSSSAQINADSITNFDSNVKDKLNSENVHSGSYLGTASTSNLSEGSNLYYTDARVKTKLNAETVISGSSQVNLASVTGNSTSNVTEGSNLYYTDARVKTKLNAENVISGSSQVVLSTTNVSEGTNLYYTDARVKTKLNAEAVVSGSSQILTLVSIDEDTMTSNSDTKLPTQQSVKAYVDSKVSALVDSAPGALDTLNELAAALGDDANFSTTVTNSIATKANSSVTITAGNGLTGGGDLTASRTIAVGGTTDRISVSADAVDIASTYVGQSSITTLGTITTGTWNGSVIASAYLDADTAHLTTTQTFSGAKTFSAAVNISDSTASTTKTSGALIVTGGVGVSGDVNVGGDVVAYASSDERLKDNIELISNPIEKVQSLKGVTWSWNDLASETQKLTPSVGVIAQDVEKVLPQLVHDRDNGFKGVDYAKLTGLLIEAIKEQQKQIEELKSKLA